MWSSTSADVSEIPATLDEFDRRYSRLVTYSIRRVSRGRVKPQDLDDLRQLVYIRIWQKNYLDRCRVLIAERHGTVAFTTLIFWLVRSVCVNQFAKNLRNPLNHALRLADPRDARTSRRTEWAVDIEPDRCDVTFEDRLLDFDTLERLHRFVTKTTRGARLAATLQLLYEGYSLPEITAMTRSKRRCRVVKDRWALRDALVALTHRAAS